MSKRNNSNPQNSSKKKKRKIPSSFLDCASMLQVVDFPEMPIDPTIKEHALVTTNPLTDIKKELLLDRLAKEIVNPFSPDRSKYRKLKDNKEGSSRIWKKRIVMGTNQCLRILEGGQQIPLICVCTRDLYPPTMLAHVPVIAKRNNIPLLLLSGKGSVDLGKTLKVRKTSILLILKSTNDEEKDRDDNTAVDSFCDYAVKLLDEND